MVVDQGSRNGVADIVLLSNALVKDCDSGIGEGSPPRLALVLAGILWNLQPQALPSANVLMCLGAAQQN